QQESYKEASGGKRLVQYFDKGRMELTNGTVTNGLLATEIVKGEIQTGDATFQSSVPPAIPVAGDPDNVGPTYATLSSKGKPLFDAAPQQTGNYAQAVLSSAGDISVSNAGSSDPATFAAYDNPTKHNMPKAFADYRAKAGLQTIGYSISEPFTTMVKVGGQSKQVMIQVFERRVLTYTASNADAFRVEMGNIGAHYYQWRYGTTSVSSPASPTSAPATSPVPPPATTSDAIGQTLTCKCSYSGKSTFNVTVNDIKRSATIGKASASGLYAVFFVHVTNTGKEPGFISDSGLVVLDSQGRKFSTSGASSAQSAAQEQYHLKGFYDDVQPSLSADMVFVFDIAPDATDLHLTLGQPG
ncbi:MAG: DUF4352 domain-containing protein, partial [Chloroflexota bacterium]|nr:DUF4352 domain-containing protein [Chloroflexota bacterium]